MSGALTKNRKSTLNLLRVVAGDPAQDDEERVIHPDSLVTMDTFYGPTYRHVQRDFSGWPRDTTQYQIRANELHLEYYSYPADAPVLTRRVLYRVPWSR